MKLVVYTSLCFFSSALILRFRAEICFFMLLFFIVVEILETGSGIEPLLAPLPV